MAMTVGELKVTLPIFTEINGIRYEFGTVDLPVRLRTTASDGLTITVTGDIGSAAEVEDAFRSQLKSNLGRR